MPDSSADNIQASANPFSRFLRASLAELKYNASRARKCLILDAAILIARFALFEVNNLIVKPMLSAGEGGFLNYLMQCHANDFLGGLAFLAYTNLLLDLVKPESRFKKLITIMIFILLCGIFWECVAPIFIADSVGDPYDLLAYAIGAASYGLLSRTAQSH